MSESTESLKESLELQKIDLERQIAEVEVEISTLVKDHPEEAELIEFWDETLKEKQLLLTKTNHSIFKINQALTLMEEVISEVEVHNSAVEVALNSLKFKKSAY